jgi:hypothetical protein
MFSRQNPVSDSRGMMERAIQGQLHEMFGAEGSLKLISAVTDALLDEAKAAYWRRASTWRAIRRS